VTSWLALLNRRRRRTRRVAFLAAHQANRAAWILASPGPWPEIALSGPWAGFAEDLPNQAHMAQSSSVDQTKSI